MKNAPEDNMLTPDQLRQALPRLLNSMRHAQWPADIVAMFATFFDEVL